MIDPKGAQNIFFLESCLKNILDIHMYVCTYIIAAFQKKFYRYQENIKEIDYKIEFIYYYVYYMKCRLPNLFLVIKIW